VLGPPIPSSCLRSSSDHSAFLRCHYTAYLTLLFTSFLCPQKDGRLKDSNAAGSGRPVGHSHCQGGKSWFVPCYTSDWLYAVFAGEPVFRVLSAKCVVFQQQCRSPGPIMLADSDLPTWKFSTPRTHLGLH
jgi:hypothetical protein